MARPLRIEFDGALYHVTSRGNGKRDIFLDDTDRLIFLDTLEEVIKKFNWLSHAYCLMNNHYHLLVETPDGNISSGMRHLNGVYTQRFNKRHNKVGHLFQGRYKAILINKESHLLEVARYIVLNPVRAKLVEKPQFWKWSSFSATAYREEHPCVHVDWILSQFSDDVKNAKRQYVKFVLAGVGEDSIWKDVTSQILLGDEVFIEKLLPLVKEKESLKEIPRVQRYLKRPELEEIFKGISIEDKRIRNEKMFEAVYKWGYKQSEVADYLGVHYSMVSKVVRNSRFKT
jgi:REP element-mobilizing transposase RayT